MNAGYNPAAPVTNPNAPDWAKSVIVSTQVNLDKQYLHGNGNSLDHFYAVADAWKVTETQNRARSADPEHYVPAPFTTPVPKREIYDWSDADQQLFSRFEQDPAVQPPVLDPYVKPVEVPPGISTTGAQIQQVAILSMLVKIQQDVAAIKGRLGL